ncbi:MAG: hypothetical protein CTY29_06865 [Methylobacter sp.]|nr:MAG: hypothetical protein CTY29_06865 [Methylobacter sp.]PPD34585.1 MAG: hypothetical protein CTY18_08155 [Methylomonas sp.]
MNNLLKKLTIKLFAGMIFLSAGASSVAHAGLGQSYDAFAMISQSCSPGFTEHPELVALKQQILASASLEEAKKLALAPTDEAISALQTATVLAPFSGDLDATETRLSRARKQIQLASSQAQVADEFEGMMLAGLDNDKTASVKLGKDTECNYSSGETIAIVIGLILGIIPGLVLLVLLC